MKNLIIILFSLLIKSNLAAQVTLIPDSRFERALIDLGIDSDNTINGQVLTADVAQVISLNLSPASLTNYPYPAATIYDGMIHDLSGLEAFVNLENLVLNVTMVENLDLSSLPNLRYLDCVDSMLIAIDVSNNPLLEYINVKSEGDVSPFNQISDLDLSNNPNINNVNASGVSKINLNNNNNSQIVNINVGCTYCFDFPSDYIQGNVCLKVDNPQLAQSNQLPYSNWIVNHQYRNINYTDNLDQCSLGTAQFFKDKLVISPNPARDFLMVNIDSKTDFSIYNIAGQILQSGKLDNNSKTIDVRYLPSGIYFIKFNNLETKKFVKK